MNRNLICMFTGHREISYDRMMKLNERLEYVVEYLISAGVTTFRAGGARGFDTLAAMKVLEAKPRHPHIRLELYIPCPNQTKGWPPMEQKLYDEICAAADEVVTVSDHYYRGCMHVRNRRMVEGSHFCIAYCEKEGSGTAYTLRYAQKQNVRTFNLAAVLDSTIFPTSLPERD